VRGAALFPGANLNLQFVTFGRLRPVHTNAVIFAFVGNGMFMGIYYSLQRLCKARMFSDKLSWLNFWGWNAIIVAAAITLPLGFTTSKEYAELEWPIKSPSPWSGWRSPSTCSAPSSSAAKSTFTWPSGFTLPRPDGGVLHIVNSWKCRQPLEGLFDLRRRAGRAGAMVVRPQRGGLLPHHALPGA
jgi:hypothetical protein